MVPQRTLNPVWSPDSKWVAYSSRLRSLYHAIFVSNVETGETKQVTDGLADAAFLTYLSGLTSRAFTATQYALLSSLAAVPLRTLGAASGWLAEWLGWHGFFLLTTAAALPAMGIMLWLLRRLPPEPTRPAAAVEHPA